MPHNLKNTLAITYLGLIALLGGCALPPIQQAAGAGDIVEVDKLLNSGIDPNTPNAFGWTALHNTAYKNPGNGPKIVAALVAAGADVHAQTFDGYTPLHTAAASNHKAVARALIEAGANPEFRAPNGKTPLDLAREANAFETVEYLEEVTTYARALPASSPSSAPRGVAIYPFAAKGGADGAIAEGLTSVFAGKLAANPCVRLVAEDIIRDLARQQGLEQACGTESCQIDLAEQARADVLVRGDLARVGETYVLTAIAVDLASKQTLLSESARTGRPGLVDEAEALGARVGASLACPGK